MSTPKPLFSNDHRSIIEHSKIEPNCEGAASSPVEDDRQHLAPEYNQNQSHPVVPVPWPGSWHPAMMLHPQSGWSSRPASVPVCAGTNEHWYFDGNARGQLSTNTLAGTTSTPVDKDSSEKKPPPRRHRKREMQHLDYQMHPKSYPCYPYVPFIPVPYSYPYYMGYMSPQQNQDGESMWPGIPERNVAPSPIGGMFMPMECFPSMIHSPGSSRSFSPATLPTASYMARPYRTRTPEPEPVTDVDESVSSGRPRPPPRSRCRSADGRTVEKTQPTRKVKKTHDKSSADKPDNKITPILANCKDSTTTADTTNAEVGITNLDDTTCEEIEEIPVVSQSTQELSQFSSELRSAFQKFERSVDAFKSSLISGTTPNISQKSSEENSETDDLEVPSIDTNTIQPQQMHFLATASNCSSFSNSSAQPTEKSTTSTAKITATIEYPERGQYVDSEDSDQLLPTSDYTTAEEGCQKSNSPNPKCSSPAPLNYKWVLQNPNELAKLLLDVDDKDYDEIHSWRAEVSLWRARLIVSLCHGCGLDRQDWATFQLMVNHPLTLDLKLSLLHAPRLCFANASVGAASLRIGLIHLAQYGEELLSPEATRQPDWNVIQMEAGKPWAPVVGAVEILHALGYKEHTEHVYKYYSTGGHESSLIARLTLDMMVLAEELRLYLTGRHADPSAIADLFCPQMPSSRASPEQPEEDAMTPFSSTYGFVSAVSHTSLDGLAVSNTSLDGSPISTNFLENQPIVSTSSKGRVLSTTYLVDHATSGSSSTEDEKTLQITETRNNISKTVAEKDFTVCGDLLSEIVQELDYTKSGIFESKMKECQQIEDKQFEVAKTEEELFIQDQFVINKSSADKQIEVQTMQPEIVNSTKTQSMKFLKINASSDEDCLTDSFANNKIVSDFTAVTSSSLSPVDHSFPNEPASQVDVDKLSPIPICMEDHIYEEIGESRILRRKSGDQLVLPPSATPPPLPPKCRNKIGELINTIATDPGSLNNSFNVYSSVSKRRKRPAPLPPEMLDSLEKVICTERDNRHAQPVDSYSNKQSTADEFKPSCVPRNPFYDEISPPETLNSINTVMASNSFPERKRDSNPFDDKVRISGYVGKNPFYEELQQIKSITAANIISSENDQHSSSINKMEIDSIVVPLQIGNLTSRSKRKAPSPPGNSVPVATTSYKKDDLIPLKDSTDQCEMSDVVANPSPQGTISVQSFCEVQTQLTDTKLNDDCNQSDISKNNDLPYKCSYFTSNNDNNWIAISTVTSKDFEFNHHVFENKHANEVMQRETESEGSICKAVPNIESTTADTNFHDSDTIYPNQTSQTETDYISESVQSSGTTKLNEDLQLVSPTVSSMNNISMENTRTEKPKVPNRFKFRDRKSNRSPPANFGSDYDVMHIDPIICIKSTMVSSSENNKKPVSLTDQCTVVSLPMLPATKSPLSFPDDIPYIDFNELKDSTEFLGLANTKSKSGNEYPQSIESTSLPNYTTPVEEEDTSGVNSPVQTDSSQISISIDHNLLPNATNPAIHAAKTLPMQREDIHQLGAHRRPYQTLPCSPELPAISSNLNQDFSSKPSTMESLAASSNMDRYDSHDSPIIYEERYIIPEDLWRANGHHKINKQVQEPGFKDQFSGNQTQLRAMVDWHDAKNTPSPPPRNRRCQTRLKYKITSDCSFPAVLPSQQFNHLHKLPSTNPPPTDAIPKSPSTTPPSIDTMPKSPSTTTAQIYAIPKSPSTTPPPFAAIPKSPSTTKPPIDSIPKSPSTTPPPFYVISKSKSTTPLPFDAIPKSLSTTPPPFDAIPKSQSTTSPSIDVIPKSLSTTPPPINAIPKSLSTTPPPFDVIPKSPSTTPPPFDVIPKSPSTTPPPFDVIPKSPSTTPPPFDVIPKSLSTTPPPFDVIPKSPSTTPPPFDVIPKSPSTTPPPFDAIPKSLSTTPPPFDAIPKSPSCGSQPPHPPPRNFSPTPPDLPPKPGLPVPFHGESNSKVNNDSASKLQEFGRFFMCNCVHGSKSDSL